MAQKPSHPVLTDWIINRKLEKLESRYSADQESKPNEIRLSSIANPGVAAIRYMVERLERHVNDIKAVYEIEVDAGRLADSPELWEAIYSHKISPSLQPKIRSLVWKLTHHLWLTGAEGLENS